MPVPTDAWALDVAAGIAEDAPRRVVVRGWRRVLCPGVCPTGVRGCAPPVSADGPHALQPELCVVSDVDAGETVFDYTWYPRMSSSDAATCVCVPLRCARTRGLPRGARVHFHRARRFLTTARAHPIQLWDAITGKVPRVRARVRCLAVCWLIGARGVAGACVLPWVLAPGRALDCQLRRVHQQRRAHPSGLRARAHTHARARSLRGTVTCLRACPCAADLHLRLVAAWARLRGVRDAGATAGAARGATCERYRSRPLDAGKRASVALFRACIRARMARSALRCALAARQHVRA